MRRRHTHPRINLVTCTSCRQTIEGTADFCPHCGAKLTLKRGWAGSPLWIYVYAAAFAVLVYLALGLFAKEWATPAEPPEAPAKPAADEEADHPMLASLEAAAANGDPGALIDLADAAYQLSRQDPRYLSRAVDPLQRFLSDHPNHSYALRFLGNVYYDLEQHRPSIDMYRRYLELNPKDANVLTDMGTQLLFDGRTQAAIKAYRQAIDIFPNHYHAHMNLHIAYQQLSDDEKAAMYLARAGEIEAEHGRAMAPIIEHPRLP